MGTTLKEYGTEIPVIVMSLGTHGCGTSGEEFYHQALATTLSVYSWEDTTVERIRRRKFTANKKMWPKEISREICLALTTSHFCSLPNGHCI
jgi:hypothetical protein